METRRLVIRAYSQAASTTSCDVPPGVDRHQFVAQLVVGRVQRQRQGDRQPLGGQLLHPRHQADRGHGDPAGAQPEPVGGRGGQLPHGADDRLVVGQRLAHAHEHHVVDPARSAGDLAAGEPARAVDHLLDDLGRAEVALQTRPDRWRRTGRPCRSRPGWRRTSSPGPDSASARSPPGPRRAAATGVLTVVSSSQRSSRTGVSSWGMNFAASVVADAGWAGRSTRPGRRAAPRSSAPTAAGPGTRADRPPRRTRAAGPESGRPSAGAAARGAAPRRRAAESPRSVVPTGSLIRREPGCT